MAKLSEDTVKGLATSLEALRTAVKGVHPEWQFDRQQRIDAALGRLDALRLRLPKSAGGESDASWQALPEADAGALAAELRAIRVDLLGLLDGDGPADPLYHPMRFAYASPGWIGLLVFLGLAGSSITLTKVWCLWPAATGDKPPSECAKETPPAPSAATTAAPSASSSPSAVATSVEPSASASSSAVPPPAAPPSASVASGAPAPSDSASPKPAAAPSASIATAPASSAPPAPKGSAAPVSSSNPELHAAAEELKEAAKALQGVGPCTIHEQDVLHMVILMGLLGGFLRLTTSVTKYVGNRALLRSWIVYYLLMPVVAASLAPMVYLLLRVGVLNANGAGGGNATAHLNVFGLYAFAGLTGLFAEQAMGMLKDIFTRVFGGVEGKDALAKGAAK